jgi:hypothetical protein
MPAIDWDPFSVQWPLELSDLRGCKSCPQPRAREIPDGAEGARDVGVLST